MCLEGQGSLGHAHSPSEGLCDGARSAPREVGSTTSTHALRTDPLPTPLEGEGGGPRVSITAGQYWDVAVTCPRALAVNSRCPGHLKATRHVSSPQMGGVGWLLKESARTRACAQCTHTRTRVCRAELLCTPVTATDSPSYHQQDNEQVTAPPLSGPAAFRRRRLTPWGQAPCARAPQHQPWQGFRTLAREQQASVKTNLTSSLVPAEGSRNGVTGCRRPQGCHCSSSFSLTNQHGWH